MDYDKVIGQGFSAVWRHKSLWALGCIGVMLAGLGSGVSAAFQLNWQADLYQTFFSLFALEGEMSPQEAQEFFRTFMGPMVGVYATAGLAMLMAFLSYLVSLVTRGAIIDQAASSATTGTVDWRQGLQAGLSRAPYLFLIDLAWWLPGIVLFGGLFACGILGMFGSIAATVDQTGEPKMGVFFASIIGFFCLFLVFIPVVRAGGWAVCAHDVPAHRAAPGELLRVHPRRLAHRGGQPGADVRPSDRELFADVAAGDRDVDFLDGLQRVGDGVRVLPAGRAAVGLAPWAAAGGRPGLRCGAHAAGWVHRGGPPFNLRSCLSGVDREQLINLTRTRQVALLAPCALEG